MVAKRASHEFEFARGEDHHAQQQPAVAPALDIGFAVGAFPIPDGNVGDFEVLLGGAEEQVEIPKRVEVAEIGAVGRDVFVVGAAQDFGAAERVFDGLTEEPGEDEAEGFVSAEIEELHGALVHGVYEANAISELGASGSDDVIKFREFLRGHRQIGVEDHQDVTAGGGETGADGVAFAAAGLAEGFDAEMRVRGGDVLDLGPRVVAGMALYKDELGPGAHLRRAGDGGGDVAGFVAGGNDDGNREGGRRFVWAAVRPSHDEDREAKEGEERREDAVDPRSEAAEVERDEDMVFGADDLPVGEGEEVFDVGRGEPIGLRRGGAEAEPAGEGEERAPEVGVVVDDEPGFRGGDRVDAFEDGLRVDGVVECFG